jgi:hypothetical protein
MLAQEIEAAKQRELIAALNAGDARLAADVAAKLPTQVELGNDVRLRLQHFVEWSARHGARACAARPTTVAAWVLAHGHLGADNVMAILAAIEALHDHHGLSLPTKSAVVCKALESVFTIDPPRSWPAADRALFATLPAQIQHRIAEREQQRDRELRRVQSEYAELKKQLQPDAPQAVTTEKEKA